VLPLPLAAGLAAVVSAIATNLVTTRDLWAGKRSDEGGEDTIAGEVRSGEESVRAGELRVRKACLRCSRCLRGSEARAGTPSHSSPKKKAHSPHSPTNTVTCRLALLLSRANRGAAWHQSPVFRWVRVTFSLNRLAHGLIGSTEHRPAVPESRLAGLAGQQESKRNSTFEIICYLLPI
jgi:hypothetical protein